MSSAKKRVAVIGECLIELNGTPFGVLQQAFGGDTLNTALYLARIAGQAIEVKYVSVLGMDSLSDGMLQRWRAEEIGTDLVLRDASRLPGLYLIQVDEHGERTFLYWRSESAARYLLRHPGFARVAAELHKVDLVFLSGISLAILPAEDRLLLLELLKKLVANGVTLAFDCNYRAALWPSPEPARAIKSALMPLAKLVFATFDDEQRLWSDDMPQTTLARLHGARAQQVILKMGAQGCLHSDGSRVTEVPALAVPVVDTTAAGDAFNAGFLSRWLMGRSAGECCRAGNVLAGTVIQHRGAIIPAAAMPAESVLVSLS